MTRYAELILELINQSKEHLTAEQIFLALKKTEPKVVQATVYNNLNTLYREGQIRKLSIESSPDRYDRIRKHDHLVCRRCGKLSDIELDDLTETLQKQVGVSMLSYDLKILYLCEECSKIENKLIESEFVEGGHDENQ